VGSLGDPFFEPFQSRLFKNITTTWRKKKKMRRLRLDHCFHNLRRR
jgi:hypothetical protein